VPGGTERGFTMGAKRGRWVSIWRCVSSWLGLRLPGVVLFL
jgi:hypothetical protein